MTERVNPFADISALPVFEPKPKAAKPVHKETIDRIAKENNFPSRQVAKVDATPVRRRRAYTTGRNQQINFKATPQTIDRFYKMADERHVPLCKLLEQALDALDGKGSSNKA